MGGEGEGVAVIGTPSVKLLTPAILAQLVDNKELMAAVSLQVVAAEGVAHRSQVINDLGVIWARFRAAWGAESYLGGVHDS